MPTDPHGEKIKADGGIQIPTGATAGYIAKSDANGNISWVAPDWKTFLRIAPPGEFINIPAGTSGNQMLFSEGITVVGNANSSVAAFYMDPADFPAAPGETRQIKLRAFVATNSTAPGVNFDFTLKPVASWTGGPTGPIIGSLGATITTASIPTPAAISNPPYKQDSPAVAFPASGWYVVVLALSGATTPSSNEQVGAVLRVL